METIILAVCTVTIIVILSGTVCWGLWLHHKREAYRLKTHEIEVQQMFLLSDKALDLRMLPPAFQEHVRFNK